MPGLRALGPWRAPPRRFPRGAAPGTTRERYPGTRSVGPSPKLACAAERTTRPVLLPLGLTYRAPVSSCPGIEPTGVRWARRRRRAPSAGRRGSGRRDPEGRNQDRRARTRRLAARRGLGAAGSAKRPPAAPHPPCPLRAAHAALNPPARPPPSYCAPATVAACSLQRPANGRGARSPTANGSVPMSGGREVPDGAGRAGRAPRPPPPVSGAAQEDSAPPFGIYGGDGGSFFPPLGRLAGLRKAVPARLRTARARRGEGQSAAGPPAPSPTSCPSDLRSSAPSPSPAAGVLFPAPRPCRFCPRTRDRPVSLTSLADRVLPARSPPPAPSCVRPRDRSAADVR